MNHLVSDEQHFARALVFVTAAGLALAAASSIDLASDVSLAICKQLSDAHGATCADERAVQPFDTVPAVLGSARAVVRATPSGDDHADLFLVEEWILGGRAAGLRSVHALTRTSAVDEQMPTRSGSKLAFLGSAGSLVEGVTVVDLAGVPADDGDDLSLLERAQVAVGRWQETGSWRGWSRSHRDFDRPVDHASIHWNEDGTLACDLDREPVILATTSPSAMGIAAIAPLELEETARPAGLVPWLVDRLRATQWFGDVKMQWLKGAVFGGLDTLRDLTSRFERRSTVADAQEDLGLPNEAPVSATAPHVAGWPPPATCSASG